MKNNKKIIIASVLGLAVILSIVIGYGVGYRVSSSLKVGKAGKLTMTVPLAQTSIFIDQDQRIDTTKENEPVYVSLSPGLHQIIVSGNGYFPWTKEVTIPSGGAVTLSPIFVAQNTSGSIITKNDPEYEKIKKDIALNKLPTRTSPITSFDASTALWVENNAILVKTPTATTTVIQPDTEIRNVSFYKNRSDVVIFSTNSTIYAIEVNGDGTQNFMPIYKGTKPSFIAPDPNYIYVEDATALMQVAI